jgi:hypothetical protein
MVLKNERSDHTTDEDIIPKISISIAAAANIRI